MDQLSKVPLDTQQLTKRTGFRVVTASVATYQYVRIDPSFNRIKEFFTLYNEAIKALPDKINVQFIEVVSEIRPLLVSRYEISPQSLSFSRWFVENKFSSLFDITFNVFENQRSIKLHLNLNWEALYCMLQPKISVSDLGQYCQWRRNMVLAELEHNGEQNDANFTLTNRLTDTDKQLKSKRKNDSAREREMLVYRQYDVHLKDGYSHETALDKMVLNLKREFRTTSSANRRKSIKRILKRRNSKEQ